MVTITTRRYTITSAATISSITANSSICIRAAVTAIATIAAFVYLLLGGFTWITSGGDKANVEAAQKRIQAAIIGLIIVFAAWALMIVIGRFLGIDPFNFVLPSPAS